MPTFKAADWSGHFRNSLQQHIIPRYQGNPLIYLEIGIYEGRSGCYALDNLLTHPESRYIGVDQWFWHMVKIPETIEPQARENFAPYGTKATIFKGNVLSLPRLMDFVPCLDVAYVDGGHLAHETLLDSVVCWELLRPGGTMFWDDVGCDGLKTDWPEVWPAIKAFLSCREGQYRELFSGYQYGIIKL